MDEDSEISPCGQWKHDHPPVRDVNTEFAQQQSTGQQRTLSVLHSSIAFPKEQRLHQAAVVDTNSE